MVAEEDEYRRPVPHVDVVSQRAQHLIGILKPLNIGGNRIQIFPGQPAGGDRKADFLLGHGGIGLMILHGNGKEKGRLL